MNKHSLSNSACRPTVICLLIFFIAGAQNQAYAQAPASSGLSLIGTIISKSFEGAVIKDSKGEQAVYRLHEKLPDGSQLVGVAGDSVMIKGSDGAQYDLYISHEKTASAALPATSIAPVNVTPAPSQPPPTAPNPEAVNAIRQRRHGHRPGEE
jgi:hypothetical protein